MYSIHCTLYSTVYSVQLYCTLYTVQLYQTVKSDQSKWKHLLLLLLLFQINSESDYDTRMVSTTDDWWLMISTSDQWKWK